MGKEIKVLCDRCVHYPICEWSANNTVFKFPEADGECTMRNTDFDDVEEAVSIAFGTAKSNWDEAREDTYDPTKAAFFKGRWSAFKDVLELMSTKGE